VTAAALGGASRPRGEKIRDEDLPPAYRALKEWRRERAQEDGVPAYVVFHDATLAEIVRVAPRSETELAGVAGVGPAKLERYGADVLAVLSREPTAVAG
jgi:ATP-dependent DNA helicase RecQ